MMNKLDYAVGADGHIRDATWNARHRDAANLARFTGHNMEVLLNWQTVNLASPVEDWHDAPMLYLSGSRALDLTPYEQSKLKLYVEQGGMIVANAETPSLIGPAAQRGQAGIPRLGARHGAAFCSEGNSARCRRPTLSWPTRAIDPTDGRATPALRG